MNYNDHWKQKGKHAFMSASKYSWLRYDDEHMLMSFAASTAAQRGTELHELAAKLITMGVRLPRSRKTLNMYVNDAIGFRLVPEQILYYSDFCFGTTDAISQLDDIARTRVVRISDLKTGDTKASMDQLMIYAAIFCLEYSFKPETLKFILSIYQNDDVDIFEANPDDISVITAKIVHFDKLIKEAAGIGM